MGLFKFLGIAMSIVVVVIVGKSAVVASSSDLRIKQIQNSAKGFQFKEELKELQDLKDEQKNIWSLDAESVNGRDGIFSIGEVLKIVPERLGYSVGSAIYYIRHEASKSNA